MSDGGYMELRFCYNPYENIFLYGGNSHTEDIYNNGYSEEFDSFIRGIIKDNILYLRLYYPYKGINDLSLNEINIISNKLLVKYKKEILQKIKKNLKIKIESIVNNATNDLLAGKLVNV